MSKFKMEVDLGNACFHDDDGDFDPGFELAAILQLAARQAKDGYVEGRCHDANGNHVGDWKIVQN